MYANLGEVMRFFFITIAVVGIVGFLILGSVGAVIGTVLGLFMGVGKRNVRPQGQRKLNIQSAFFEATFLVMGKLTKADGPVNENEIQLASALMSEMRLSQIQRKKAIDLFNQGKVADAITIRDVLHKLRRSSRAPELVNLFLEIQIQAAYADSKLSDSELAVLHQVCDDLGVSHFVFGLLHQRVKAQCNFSQRYKQQSKGRDYRSNNKVHNELLEAYAVLGVTGVTPFHEVKKAYRLLMKEHHPDKMVAKGLPESMINLAKEKTQKIQAAYDLIQSRAKVYS